METGRMKLALSAGALALSMVLAGCGGGGSSSGTAQPIIPTNTQPDPQQLASTADTALETANSALEGLGENADPAAAAALVEAARRAVTAAANAEGHTGHQALLTALEARLQTAQTNFTPPPVTPTAAMCVADGQVLQGTACADMCTADYTANDDGLCVANPKESAADVKGRAVGVYAALGDLGTEDKKATISYAHGESVKITRTGFTAGSTPTSVEGWTGATLEKTNAVVGVDSKEKIVVYTDIAAPTLKSWASTYGATPEPTRIPGTTKPFTPGAAIDDNNNIVLTGGATNRINKDVAKLLDSSRFLPSKNGKPEENTFKISAGETGTSFTGTFHGASGTYTIAGTPCGPTGTGCKIIAQPDGRLNISADVTITFAPSTPEAKQVQQADRDYMQFGYWIKTPDEANDENDFNYEVSLIATGGQVFPNDSSQISNLAADGVSQRRATYKGAAAGVYSDNETHGEFTADASLTALFNKTGSNSDENVLSGKISNFQGAADMTGWLVELEEAPIAGTNQALVADTATVKAEMGDAVPNSTPGNWSASLWGPTTNNQAPSGVTGQFNAEFVNARIVGAFGAKRQ